MADAVDKARAWDAIAEKNAEIARLRAQVKDREKLLREIQDTVAEHNWRLADRIRAELGDDEEGR